MTTGSQHPPVIGVVVIGRNEGERLVRGLRSVHAAPEQTLVYVDSGSRDGSLQAAHEAGAEVVSLDLSKPFSAGRARNAGVVVALRRAPNLDFIQFMDGDCELDDRWLATAAGFLATHPEVAIVCGRRRERFPERSIYNKLCDMEWDTPVGEARECGGDFLARVTAFHEVGGFAENLPAGEEPDLCARLRSAGWKTWRLDTEMTRHDANILQWTQWWRRSMRCGYAYAANAQLHGTAQDKLKLREMWSAILWGGALPALTLVGARYHPQLLCAFIIYPIQAIRIAVGSTHKGKDGLLFGTSIMFGKFAEFVGIVKFAGVSLFGRDHTLIEYK